ncbi:MAG: YCF48-related protein [Patescibacteria group bacterium]|nr:YCF48-related protein [Patescibacteria group bacterium]MDD4611068.1 YCF48-related protein [Patescibacteria group bacterium]
MRNKNFLFSLFLFFTLSLTLSGCTIQFGSQGGGATDGGVWATTDKGDNWQQRITVPASQGSPKSIAALDGYSFAMDPSDNKAFYFGSVDNGLFFTYNKTSEWQLAKTLGQVTVADIAVDPEAKCIIYAAVGNRVYKSTDCTRSWTQSYYDNDLMVKIVSIAVDPYNSKNVYIGTSRGEIIKSSDKGVSWQTVVRLDNEIRKIVISSHDSRIIFAATADDGIFRSYDSGANWVSLAEALKDFNSSVNFRDMSLSKSEKGFIYLASNYGLLKSTNNGDTWSKIELITPEDGAVINAIAVSPKNVKEVYYVTNTTFYRSIDGGENWTTRKLPTTRAGWKLIVDTENNNLLYLTVKTIKK